MTSEAAGAGVGVGGAGVGVGVPRVGPASVFSNTATSGRAEAGDLIGNRAAAGYFPAALEPSALLPVVMSKKLPVPSSGYRLGFQQADAAGFFLRWRGPR